MVKGKKKSVNVTKPSSGERDSSQDKQERQDAAASAPPPPPQTCAFSGCQLLASKCGGCGKVAYCSKEHQKSHWRLHKEECVAWKIGESPELGRYLWAVRDIKAGEIILTELPLLVTPPKITLPVCLGCYSEFKEDGAETDDGAGVKPYNCRNNCGWPMCKSALCSSSKEHQGECRISQARGNVTIRNADTVHPLYQLIGVLRALGLRDRDPTSFANLISLEANIEKRKEFQRTMEEQCGEAAAALQQGASEVKVETLVNMVQNFFQQSDITEEWIVRLMGIIETNGHEIPIPDKDGQINRRLIAVYHNSSFLEHSCLPNCAKTWDLSTKSIVIRSTIPIKKGSHLSISYVDPLWGTNDRLGLLRMTKFFTCCCSRCKDPTELGTHISSLRCRRVSCRGEEEGTGVDLPKVGMVVPKDPYCVPSADAPSWTCCSCGEEYDVSYVYSLLQKAGEELQELHDKFGDISAKEEYLRKFGKSLSPTHHYLLELKLTLAQLYGRTPDEPLHIMEPKKLLRKIGLCQELLAVFAVICPGYTRLRGLILYELQAAVFTLSRIRLSVGDISMDMHLEEMMQCGKWMTEVKNVLKWEPVNSIERKRAEGAERDLEILKSSVLSLQSPTSTPTSPTKPSASVSHENENANGGSSKTSVDEDSFIEEVF